MSSWVPTLWVPELVPFWSSALVPCELVGSYFLSWWVPGSWVLELVPLHLPKIGLMFKINELPCWSPALVPCELVGSYFVGS